MPFAGTAAEESHQWQILRLAGRLQRRTEVVGLLESRRPQSRRADVHAFPGWHRTQEPHAGERFRPEPDVCARGHVFLLPRSARQRERCNPTQACERGLPDLSWAKYTERAAWGIH